MKMTKKLEEQIRNALETLYITAHIDSDNIAQVIEEAREYGKEGFQCLTHDMELLTNKKWERA